MDEYEETINFKLEDEEEEPEYGNKQFNCTSYEDRLKQISNSKFKSDYHHRTQKTSPVRSTSHDKFDTYIKQFEQQQAELNREENDDISEYENETDPYLASAIEFMYSEDTEEDFNTMGRQQQEALLKKTWLEREKQFYGEEIDVNFEI